MKTNLTQPFRSITFRHWASILLATLCFPLVAPAQKLVAVAVDQAGHSTLKQLPPRQVETKALSQVLVELEGQYRVSIVGESYLIAGKEVKKDQITLGGGKDLSQLEELLSSILHPLGLVHRRYGNSFVIQAAAEPAQSIEKLEKRPVESRRQPSHASGAVRLLVPPAATKRSLEKTITGTVTDLSTGEGLPGVNIVVKSTTVGTVTDIDGNYRLTAPDDAQTLIFSSVGYTSEEIAIDNRAIVNLEMAPDIQSLSEVVVVGYGTQEKKDITGSMSSLKEEDFNPGIVVAPEQLMQGRVSGVNITLNSGEPGANSTVRIRGGTSITAGNDPLYVIDGVPVAFSEGNFEARNDDRISRAANNPLNMLNPSDIESIDVLKDASAAAIYGSRGANGVILITTKKGQAGQSSLTLDSYVGVSQLRRKIDVLSAGTFRNYLNANAETIGEYQDGGTSTDWQDEIYRTAITQSYNVALSGGNAQTNYRASLGYLDQEGIIISSAMEKLTGRFNIVHKALNDRLTVNVNLTNAYIDNDNTPNTTSAGSDTEGGIIRDALRFNPTFPVRNADGDYTFLSVFNQNPVEQAELFDDVTETFRSLGNATVDYKLTDFLSVSTNIGFTRETVERKYYAPRASNIGAQWGGRASQESRNNTSKLLETNLMFDQQFGDRHALSALVGYSYQDFIYTGVYNRAENFVSDVTSFNNLDGGLNYLPPSSHKAGNKLISFYGRVNYEFDERYLVTATVRRDGSSRFGANNKWGVFPSAALGWRISEEAFLENNPLISNLKLRAGYGETGNQEIGNYRSLPTLSAGGNRYIIGGEVVSAVGPNQYFNPNLKWETTKQTNVGLDFGLLENRLTGSIDYYTKRTEDLLLSFRVPSPAVVPTTTANVGEVHNQGIEVELNGVLLQNNNLRWDIFGNFSRNRNEVVSLSNETWKTDEIFTGSVQAPGFTGVSTQIIRPGEPLGTFYGYEYLGAQNGAHEFRDLNNDGEITPGEDRQVIGTYQPNFYYGFGTNLSYHNWSVSVFFRGVQGVDVLNATALDIGNATLLPGFNVATPALNDGLDYGEPTLYSSRWVQDASFLRLENINLSYQLPVSSVTWLQQARLYLTGQNLLVLTDYAGYDPEVAGGTDMTNYPRPRTVLLGASITF